MRHRRKKPWGAFAAIGAIFGAVGIFALTRRASASSPSAPPQLPGAPSAGPTMLTPTLTPVAPGEPMVGPSYFVKYTADALQLIGTPAQSGPVMLCSYYPYYAADATDAATAQGLYARLRDKYETAPETLYNKSGRRWIVRLRQRFFDPKTFKELPSDTLAQSNNLFPVPIYSPDSPGVPCG